MRRALTGLDRDDLDFVWMRGLGWGAASGLMVSLVFIVFAIVAWDPAVLLMIIFMGIPALIVAVAAGGLLSRIGWRVLRRGASPLRLLIVSAALTALLIPVTIGYVYAGLSYANHFSWEAVFSSMFWLSIWCVPSFFLAVFGMWFTLRGLVRRKTALTEQERDVTA